MELARGRKGGFAGRDSTHPVQKGALKRLSQAPHKRLFASSWDWIETNAQLAFTKTNPTKKMTKHEWFLALSESCIHNPFRPARIRALTQVGPHGNLSRGSQAMCWMCKARTSWKCGCWTCLCVGQPQGQSLGVV